MGINRNASSWYLSRKKGFGLKGKTFLNSQGCVDSGSLGIINGPKQKTGPREEPVQA